MFRLDNKVAIVTGSGSGIGREIALLYAGQGAKVVVADVNLEAANAVVAEITRGGGGGEGGRGEGAKEAYAQRMNVADEDEVKGAISDTVERYNRLDILVNNAGISSVGNILETSSEEFDRVMSVNLRGVFLCSRYGVEQMVRQAPQGGVLVNIASVAGLINVDRRAAYGTSKGGVLALTRSIAIDFVGQRIRANAICPGTVHTPFVEGYLERNFADRKEEVREQLHARQPLGRMGRPDEIAYAALYLASDEAAFVTGSSFVIDGGWTAR